MKATQNEFAQNLIQFAKSLKKKQHIQYVFVCVCVEVSPVHLIKRTHCTKPNKYDTQQLVVYQ